MPGRVSRREDRIPGAPSSTESVAFVDCFVDGERHEPDGLWVRQIGRP
jgi:hypothetical protein